MTRRIAPTAILVLIAACWLTLSSLASAVVIINSDLSENNNQTTAPMPSDAAYSYAGGVPFNNVGTTSWENASVTYLGNGWAILCGHEGPNDTVGGHNTVSFNGIPYTINQTPIPLQNSLNATIDLDLIHLSSNPNLPSVLIPSLGQMPSQDPQTPTEVVMIGNGQNFDSTNPPAPLADYGGEEGYPLSTSSYQIRWGTNQIDGGGGGYITFGGASVFTTTFDNVPTPSAADQQAQATAGDSGGAVFSQIGGAWYLVGIMEAMSEYPPPNYVVLSSNMQTYNIELADYRGQIVTATLVPEPSGLILAGIGTALAAAWRAGRRRACPRAQG